MRCALALLPALYGGLEPLQLLEAAALEGRLRAALQAEAASLNLQLGRSRQDGTRVRNLRKEACEATRKLMSQRHQLMPWRDSVTPEL